MRPARSARWRATALSCLLVLCPAPPASAQEGVVEVDAAGAVLWDPLDQRVLWGRDEERGRPPASTTKVMSTLVALEAGTLDDLVTVSPTAAGSGGASLGLSAGEQFPMRTLLAGMMLASANDAAVATAEHVAGSEAAFAERMNRRAAALGLEDTRFVNASGLTDDPGHRASPLDLARLAEHAMRTPALAELAAAPTRTLPGVGTLTSRNALLRDYPGATGVKTGSTALAGGCLIASAERDGRTLYAVVLGSPSVEASFADARRLLDHGFDDHRRVTALAAGEPAGTYRWAGTEGQMTVAEPLARTVLEGSEAVVRLELDPAATLPLPAGTRLGTAHLLVDAQPVARVPLVAARAVERVEPAGPAGVVGSAIQDAVRAFARLRPVETAP